MTPLRDARDIEEARHIRDAIRRIQKRTITYSIVAAGFVSLFIGHAFDIDNSNKQAVRSRTNCEFLNDRLKISAERNNEQADRVLGNPNHKPPIEPFKFEGTPFEKFAAISISQARQQRADARNTLKGIKDCNAVFPTKKRFFIIK